MFKNADNLTKLAQLPATPTVEPFAPVVVPAGYTAAHTVGIQIAITRYKGRVSGAHSVPGKFLRLEVSRMFGYVDPSTFRNPEVAAEVQRDQDNCYSWLKTRLGNKDEDRTLRPDERHSLVMYRTQHGLKDAAFKAWVHMYKQLEEAIAWAQNQVVIDQQGFDTNAQYALVLLVSVSEWKLVRPNNPNHNAFYEAVLRGISDMEVVKLVPEPGLELPDGFEGQAGLEDSVSDFVEA